MNNIDVLALSRETVSGVTARCENQWQSGTTGTIGISFPGMAGMKAVLAANLFSAFAASNLLSKAVPMHVSVHSISVFGSRGVFPDQPEVDTDVAMSAAGLSQAFHALFGPDARDASPDMDTDEYSFS